MITNKIRQRIKQEIRNYKLEKDRQNRAKDSYFTSINCYDPGSIYEGGNYIHAGVDFTGRLGYGSYIGCDTKLPRTYIGRYCSISWNVQLIAGNHPTSQFVSTHPAFFSTQKQAGFTYVDKQKYDEITYQDRNNQYLLKIGNDVWIGSNVSILSGITIGDGSIIGAGSVVIRDIPPYAIVGGSPAKVIRYRFSEDEIDFLLNFKWWNKDKQWIIDNADSFCNIHEFMLRFNNKKKESS